MIGSNFWVWTKFKIFATVLWAIQQFKNVSMLKELLYHCFKSYGGSSKIQTGDFHKHRWWKRPRSYLYFEYFLKVIIIIVNSSAYFALALKVFLWSAILNSSVLCLATPGLSKQPSLLLCLLIVDHIVLLMWVECKNNSTNIWDKIMCFLLISNI